MDFNRTKIILMMSLVMGSFLYSQKLKISAASPAIGIFDVTIENTTDRDMTVALDTTGINFACQKDDVYNNNFLRLALCTKIPKNTDFPTGIEFNQHETNNTYGGYNSPEEYISVSTIILKPKEQKKIKFNVFKQEDAFKKLDKKSTLLKSKLILFENNTMSETFTSNIFIAKIPLKKW